MKILRAKVFFDPAGAVLDFRAHDGARERGVVRRSSEVADRPLPQPVTVKTYGELLAALEAAASVFAGEDIAEEARQAAAEEKRRKDSQAAELAAVEASKKKNKPTP